MLRCIFLKTDGIWTPHCKNSLLLNIQKLTERVHNMMSFCGPFIMDQVLSQNVKCETQYTR